jgi:hypothetical protein
LQIGDSRIDDWPLAIDGLMIDDWVYFEPATISSFQPQIVNRQSVNRQSSIVNP